MSTRFFVLSTLLLGSLLTNSLTAAESPSPEYDLVVYGGTSAGVISAVQAKRMGKTVVLVCPDKHLGGLTSGGLGYTDTGDKRAIGGLSREFYHRVWKEYNQPEAWKWQQRKDYGNKGQGTPAIDGENRTMWIFEPHVAEKVFEDFIKDYKIPVYRDEWLDRTSGKGVTKKGNRITAITTLSGKTFRGRMFIDATYEGDLLAASGVSYHVGRESTETYGERWNGVQVGVLHHRHHFGAVKQKISPYKIPGDPSSGVLPRISAKPPGKYGAADKKVQAYCFRMCLSDHPDNRVPFPKPEGYDPAQYELLARIFEAGWRETFNKFDRIPNRKTDTNNHGPFSTDNIGMNYDYPEASYERRREIIQEHRVYQQGLMYFLANDPRVPEEVRKKMADWGLAKDEFTDNGRTGPTRSMSGKPGGSSGTYVMTEKELSRPARNPRRTPSAWDLIHDRFPQRAALRQGGWLRSRTRAISACRPPAPYEIAYGSLTPQERSNARIFSSPSASPVQPHRLRFHSHGAGVHGPGPVRRHRRDTLSGRRHRGSGFTLRKTPRATAQRRAGAGTQSQTRHLRQSD